MFKMIMVLVMILTLSSCLYLPVVQDGQTSKNDVPADNRVPKETLRKEIVDKRDEFEGTREISMLVYHKNRLLMYEAAKYIQEGKPEKAEVTMNLISIIPPRLEGSVYFIKYISKNQTYYLLKFHILSPAKIFQLSNIKILVDGQLVEIAAKETNQEIRTSDRGLIYNYYYLAQMPFSIFERIGLATDVKFKFYGEDGTSCIEEFDKISLQYAKYFVDYVK